MTEEFKLLWSEGILVDGVRWRVAIINGIWDGKGYEQVTKTMGSNSQHGCNVCDFHGIYFGNTQKYPFYYRYTTLNDPRRLKRPTGVANSSRMYNLESEITRKPIVRNYDTYLRHGSAVETGQTAASEVGINGVWIFDDLLYSSLLHPTKEIMHTATI